MKKDKLLENIRESARRRQRDPVMPESIKHEFDELINIAENIMGEGIIRGLTASIERFPIEEWLCKRIMSIKNKYHPNATIVTRYGYVRYGETYEDNST